MRRHFKTAQLEKAQAAGSGVGRVQLIDAELGAMRVPSAVGEYVAENAID
jgi:hypothetical protein